MRTSIYMIIAGLLCFAETYWLGETIPMTIAAPLSLLAAVVIVAIMVILLDQDRNEPLS